MKGLLIKDFLLLRSYAKTFFLMLILFLIIGLTSGTAFVVGIIMIQCVMLAVSTFSYDEMAKWDSYMLSMPVSRKTAVREKYVLALLLGLVGVVLALAAGIASGALHGHIDLNGVLAAIGGCLAMACLYVSLMIPMTYRFGAEKMRFLLLAVFFVLFITLFGGYVLLKKAAPNALELLARAWPVFPLAVVAVLAVSYLISVRIFQKKEI